MNNSERRLLGALGKIEDSLTVAQYLLIKPLAKLYGIDVKLTRNRDERIASLTDFLDKANQESEIQEILAVEDGEGAEELAEALIASGVVELDKTHIRIVKTPAGDAPEEVRKQWVGVEFNALLIPAGKEIEEQNILTREVIPSRDSYLVFASRAIRLLGKKSKDAASWFNQNLSPDYQILSFGADEVEVIPVK